MGFACHATVSPPRSGQTLISVCVVVSSGSRAPAALWRTVGVESGVMAGLGGPKAVVFHQQKDGLGIRESTPALTIGCSLSFGRWTGRDAYDQEQGASLVKKKSPSYSLVD